MNSLVIGEQVMTLLANSWGGVDYVFGKFIGI